jgi:AraC family transcriptional regulator
MTLVLKTFPATLSSEPEGLRRHSWEGGAFTTAYRPRTDFVEGEIASSNHLVMATLRGGAKRHEIRTDDGHCYDGPDRPGSISFLPAGCARRLRLHAVEWRWATIALAPQSDDCDALALLSPFSGEDDAFVQGMLAECERLDALDGGLDPLWRESMVAALIAYLGRKFGAGTSREAVGHRLPPWRLQRINDYIAAHLSDELRIGALAGLAGLSEGHFHRAFRATTGHTPLHYISARRIDAAQQLLAKTDLSIGVIALKVGFLSPSHFARIFRETTGKGPAEYRRAFAVG